MIESAKPRIDVPMKCDVEAFFYWYGPDIELNETDDITLAQYKDFMETGLYKERSAYN